MKSELIDFCLLQSRLLALLREQIQAGEFTERHLARISGVSQPHVHNVLKGVRELTPATADRFLHCLTWTIPDLLEDGEMTAAIQDRAGLLAPERELRVLTQKVGPGCAWPAAPSRYERLVVGADLVRDFWNPVAAHMVPDAEMEGAFDADDIAVLDLGDLRENDDLPPDQLFLVAVDGETRVRWLRRGARHLYLVAAQTRDQPDRWTTVLRGSATIAARVRISGIRPRRDVPRRPPDRAPTPARRSAAS